MILKSRLQSQSYILTLTVCCRDAAIDRCKIAIFQIHFI